MRKTVILLIAFCFILSLTASANPNQIKQINRTENIPSFLGYVQDRFVVVMKSEVINAMAAQPSAKASPFMADAGFVNLSDQFQVSSIVKQFETAQAGLNSKTADLARYYKVSFGSGTLEDAMEAYRGHPDVESVEPIGIHTLLATPNDGFYDPYQWYHNQTNDDDIDSPEAWDIQTGADATIVAILDSGTRYYHRDLGGANTSPSNEGAARGNMWINTAELNGSSGVDDDSNGYTDDWIGYDFIQSTSYCWPGEDCGTQDNDPRDFNGHGTHTAGIFGMLTNNGYGMAGVAGGWGNGSEQENGNGVKIMALRMGFSYDHPIYGEVGVVYMDAAAEAFYYAADNGAKIASCSWGSSNSGGIGTAATYFINNGGIICVAAGNDGSQTADYLNGRGDCISVAATDDTDGAASFTTYGTWVDISAPGVGIYSTYHDHADPSVDYWASMDGTSMATPMVAGVCALIWSQNPSWTNAQVESQLYTSAENIDSELGGQYLGKMGAGRINAYDAVNTGPQCDLTADLSGSPTSGCAALLVNFTDLSTGTGIDGWSWDFGDGVGTSTAQNPSYTYNNPGNYSVSLTVSSSSQSCNDAVTKNGYITVNGGPTANFVGSPTSGIEPLTVDFTDQSTDATGWSWNFGDGVGTSTQENPSYTYTSAGTYTVILTATNACGSDLNTKVNYITVNPCVTPTAGFVGSPTSGDYPLTVNFTDQSTEATSYSWDFGDGVGTSTEVNPGYTYTAAGTYTVTQTVTNSCGTDQLIRTDYITVTEPPPPPPTADFVGSPTSGDYPLTVNFTDLSTDGPTSWSWDFGDGVGTSTLQNPSYTYTAAGTYTVSLTATNAYGSDIETKLDYITVTEPSTAEIAYANADIPVYGSVTGSFANTAASDDSYEVITETESTGHPVKVTSNAEHKWTFTVNSTGTTTFFMEGYRANNSDGDNFVFAYSTDNVNFTDMFTVASATEQTYSASLPNGLTGTVYVRVVDNNRSWGNTSLDPVYVDYMYIEFESTPQPPVANFAGSPTSGSVPLTVNFSDLSTGSPSSWNWDFGDGVGTSTVQNPSYTYTATGSYTVSLTVSNSQGSDNETKVNYITVTEVGSDMYVFDMVIGRGRTGPNSYGTCTATIYDDNSNPVSGATVYVTATGPTGGSYNGVTGGDGTVSFQTSAMKKPSGEWCFEVTNVTHGSFTYNSSLNNVTQSCESGDVYKFATDMIPTSFEINNYPNPFNPTTTIAMSLPQASNWTIAIFNIAGQKVDQFSGHSEAGIISVNWDGSSYASGVYFYKAVAGEFAKTQKMVLMK